jgi:predicted transcriptional regulator
MIYREERESGTFMQVYKGIADDNNLSALAKGILLYMLSKNDDWQFYESEIKAHFTDGIKIISKGIQELIDKKYIFREKIKNSKGQFMYDYDIYEKPQKD